MCKWCGEDMQGLDKCPFCGTLAGEDSPRIKKVASKAPVKKPGKK
uniref:Uncharacterized protein n=1 Tax=viral metagenome TaxID=1070528 RepID=A0A6M3LDV8_9ZZZZ